MPYVTNGILQSLSIVRTVTAPDIIFSAADLVNTGVTPAADVILTRSVTWTQNGVTTPLNGIAGSIENSVIAPETSIVFNTIGAIYFNESPAFLDQGTAVEYPIFVWGSFNGSTNPPIIFPNGTSIGELEQQVEAGGSELPPGTWNPFSIANETNTTTATVTP